jgi:acetyltransferase-like isoleucine patch superfamily enzyme
VHPSTRLGHNVRIVSENLVNLYGCQIGDDTLIGPYVEIQRGVTVGSKCKIQSHSFLCEGVTLESEVFVGHGVMFTNDLWPRATDADGVLLGADGWRLMRTLVKERASIGSGATILPVIIGSGAVIAAGAVVTRDVADHTIVAGNPARVIGDVRERRPSHRGFAGSTK